MTPSHQGRAAAALAASCALSALSVLSIPAASAAEDDAVRVFTIATPEITESSGLAVSTTEPGLVYTINDSGDSATVYVLESVGGAVVGRTRLTGVRATDIEALGAGSDGSLVVADIGDNDEKRSSVQLYKLPQPGLGAATVTPDRVTVTYSDGRHDAEGILYDGDTGTAFIVSKQDVGAQIYGTPANVFSGAKAVVRPVAPAPALATDATFLPGTDVAVIRTYLRAFVFRYPGWEQVAAFTLPLQRQGESIAAPDDGTHVWVGSEGPGQDVLSVELPDLTPAEPTPPPTTQEQPPVAEPEQNDASTAAWGVTAVAGGGAAIAMVVVGVLFWRHRNGHG